ncbi:murein L,D-transpeptidase catalytic domain family protein [Mesorhizobium sp. BAC0120]|uniref:murein L,D-transpeptidase catalytic domain family protein n=1 Tax=Mesorhizobium sp. BAC0120 TaxID=3090670 RepID=UPI00298BD709|nr:murein L,D-transpeptidase catalytic domain family protein [Mesorhizobium sp. BAC0120]MDW6024848.1 murein L,D-transpeptidase catalytic domain family protein [Mesorhizobium sp. BAC0120]
MYGFSAAGNFTVYQLANRYSGGNEGATQVYIQAWRNWSGNQLDRDTVVHLNDTGEMLILAKAMFAHEAGQISPVRDNQIMYAIEAERAGSLPTSVSGREEECWNTDLADDADILTRLAVEHGVRPAPVEEMVRYRDLYKPSSRPRYWAVLDFSLNSREKRLFVFDTLERGVDRYYCAHGRGSEGSANDGLATVFSNRSGSNASSLGIYLCSETYYGENGYSLRLDGVEDSNSNARSRAIVVHGAKYVSERWIRDHGYLGRSHGCPAVEHQYVAQIVNALASGSLLIASTT